MDIAGIRHGAKGGFASRHKIISVHSKRANIHIVCESFQTCFLIKTRLINVGNVLPRYLYNYLNCF